MTRFTEDSFNKSYIATIGIDFRQKILEVEEKRVKFQVWDSAGQERYHSITRAFYRGAMGLLLVYDVSDRASFDAIEFWFSDVAKNNHEETSKYDTCALCSLRALS